MNKVKVVKKGNHQVIEILKELQITDKELYIRKIGNSIILFPKNDLWNSFRNSLSRFSDDLFEDGREQPLLPE